MNYNYTDSPFYANLVDDKIIIEKREWVKDGEKVVRKITHFTYDVTGLTMQELDQLTRTKINELMADVTPIKLEPVERQ
jgi:hypothetical protein